MFPKRLEVPVCPQASTSSPQQMKALAVSLSYLIYDLVCCLFDKKFNIDNCVHHLVSIVGIGAGLAYQKCGSEMVAALWITELSSPFLHLRELLKELGYRDNDLNLAADAMALGLQLVSAFWFYKIARMVKYKVIKRTGPKQVDATQSRD
ncbi:transmembrane protein 136 [Prunus yedoensis var. nudiflora]|uniref:Transmembrane protein 136 n=1 Tax=Prunus yedoensis var. nudiflora TaxID=2094558 RepID=A0A314YHE3_PRUYE|nr:transmembrane protein 136 [Prunus yedoensis var. nudiflora]